MRFDEDLRDGARKLGIEDRTPAAAAPRGLNRLAIGAAEGSDKHRGRAEVGIVGFSCPTAPTIQRNLPTRITRQNMPPTGLEAVYLDNRDKLLRFLRARGAGETAEDLVHDLWLKVVGHADGPIANPMAYLYRAADLLMIDRYRSRRQAERRDQAWEEGRQDLSTMTPTPEREVGARQEAMRVAQVLRTLGERKSTIFRRARIEGVAQRAIAEELGVSLSTVESDLREVTRALVKLKDEIR